MYQMVNPATVKQGTTQEATKTVLEYLVPCQAASCTAISSDPYEDDWISMDIAALDGGGRWTLAFCQWPHVAEWATAQSAGVAL